MLLPRAIPLLALCAASAFGQSSPGIPPKLPDDIEPGAVDGTNRTAIDNAIRSLGSKIFPGYGPAPTPPSNPFGARSQTPPPSARSIPESASPVNERIVTRNSLCSVPLVRVPIEPNAAPLAEARPLAPTAPMPQFHVPAPPCDEPVAFDTRPPRRNRR